MNYPLIIILFAVIGINACSSNQNSELSEESESIQVDSISPEGYIIKGQRINGLMQGTWTFEKDSLLIKRLYVLGDVFHEEYIINDSIRSRDTKGLNKQNFNL